MSIETHTIADDQVRNAFQRWKNLEEEKARISEDLKELFAEQKAFGHDTKAMRAAFRLKVKMDEASPEDAEHEALVDTYLAALEAPRASRAYARENIEEFGANPRLIKQVVDGMQSEAGRAALIAAVDIMIEREEAEEFQAKASDDNGATEQDIEDTADSVTGDASRSSRGDDSPATHSEKATVATQGEATAPTSDERVSLPVDDRSDAVANAGGDDVDGGALRAGLADQTSNTGEGAANTALPDKPKHRLRPNCLDRSNCKSGSVDHCWSCKKAMAEKNEVAA